MLEELSKSSRSICYVCKKKIPYKVPRINNDDWEWGYKYVCYNCAEEYFRQELEGLKRKKLEIFGFKKKWKQFIKEHSREIVIANLK